MGDLVTLCSVDIALFDFGGVLADEGFANGLKAIGRNNGFDPDAFFRLGSSLVHETGYVTGRCGEAEYWNALREKTGIKAGDSELRDEILSRFTLRKWMLGIVAEIRKAGVRTGMLSDQTNWLGELNEKYDFFRYFDIVFNSYDYGKSKMEPSWFRDVSAILNIAPERTLFIDDSADHCARARLSGMHAIHYAGRIPFIEELADYCPFIEAESFKS
jgi:putative hydrolase of the HAD superfamily